MIQFFFFIFVFVNVVTSVIVQPVLVNQHFKWLENLVVDETTGDVFFSELPAGRVWRWHPGKTAAATPWLTGFGKVLGLTKCTGHEGVLFGVGALSNHTNVVFSFSTQRANVSSIIAKVPSKDLPNGLGCHNDTLYFTSEGSLLLPGSRRGALFSSSLHQLDAPSQARQIRGQLESADGLWIDQERALLYVGQLFVGNVLRFDLLNIDAPSTILPGLAGNGWLDDFTLTANGSSIVGCNWLKGQLVLMPTTSAGGPVSAVLTSQLKHPTSVRFLNSTTALVTEGNIFFKKYSQKLDSQSLPRGSGHLLSVTFSF